MSEKHTALRYQKSETTKGFVLFDDDGPCGMIYGQNEESESRCQQIVAAVNSYPARSKLLAAAKACEAWVALATGRDPVTTHPKAIQNALGDLKQLREAIREAEGGLWLSSDSSAI